MVTPPRPNVTFVVVGIVVFLVFLTISCDNNLSHKEYIKWVRSYENGAHVRFSRNDFIFDLQYQPVEYVLLQRGLQNETDSARSSEIKKLSDIQYYTLTISRKDKADLIGYNTQSLAEKADRQYYFSYRFQNDLSLNENGKILPCVLYHGERPALPSRGRTFVLGFENPMKNSTESEIMISSGMFGALPVKIKISKSNIPHVDL